MSGFLKRHIMGRHGIGIMRKHWIYLLLGACVLIAIYNMLLNIPNFFSNGYTRYKIQELELQNDLLLMQLSLTRKEAFTVNSTVKHLDDEVSCNTVKYVPKCETIHVGIICAGYKASRSVAIMLKSILFYRKNPMHFHIIVDDIAQNILTVLFDTWNLPQVNLTFYPTDDAVSLVNWVPNNHYSGVYGLLKLTLPKILPKNISKIIVLDTDLTFVSNIAELWAVFAKFDSKQAIGLVENQSNWYLGKLQKHYKPWPAIGRGFNTGVILMNLQRLKELNWSNLWISIAEETLKTHTSTALADQDIFNAVIRKNSHLLYPLSCQWNVQLGDNTLSHKCYENFDVKVIHWNSPRKHEVKNKDIEYFRGIYYTYVELNGNLLRKLMNNCNRKEEIMKVFSDDMCIEFHKFEKTKWRTHIFIKEISTFEVKGFINAIDVTLAIHLPFQRFGDFEHLCKFWEGPISAAIFATDAEADSLLEQIEHSEILRNRPNIGYHIIYKEGRLYPINTLRNIAVKFASTSYVYITDLNYFPMLDMYSYIINMISTFESLLEKKVLMIPAFEKQFYNGKFPGNKTDLLQMVEENIYTFLFDGESSNITKWMEISEPYKIKIDPKSQVNIVMDKAVPFNTRVMDPASSNEIHLQELQARGYDFWVLPEAFTVYMSHPQELDAAFMATPQYKLCLKLQKDEILNSLNKYMYIPPK